MTRVTMKATKDTPFECFVVPEWRDVEVFGQWMETQHYDGMDLDKDILVPGNRTYGPATCAFVPGYLNAVINGSIAPTDKVEPLGVTRSRYTPTRKDPAKAKAYLANIQKIDPETGKAKGIYLGGYTTPMEAHAAWQRAKAVHLEELMERYRSEPGFRLDVWKALQYRVLKLRLAAEHGVETFIV